ncbi:hypothetical protein D3C72_1158730 [compost metagenome]
MIFYIVVEEGIDVSLINQHLSSLRIGVPDFGSNRCSRLCITLMERRLIGACNELSTNHTLGHPFHGERTVGVLFDTPLIAHDQHCGHNLVEERCNDISPLCMLIVTPEGLIEQLNQWGKRAVQEAQPIHFIADVPECLSCRESTLITARQTLHVELIGFLGNFGNEVIPETLDLAVELHCMAFIAIGHDHECLVFEGNPLLDSLLRESASAKSTFVFRVLQTPLINSHVIAPDEVLF